ncbi:MAG TPA: HlyD family secretion protein [Candidatus Eisenbacteria bacterium]|jgi:membrane fusion protein (multidrug efflux system)
MSATVERSAEPANARTTPAEPPAHGAPAHGASGQGATPAAAAAARPNRIPVIVLGTLALIGLGFGIARWRWGLTHVSTDDAQVEGHIVPTLARVNGYVAEVPVSENDHVTAGQLLVRLDDREFVARLAQAEADLQSALATEGVRGHVGQAEAQIEAARATVTQAEANATRARQDAERAQKLAARGIVSSAQLDAAVTGAAAADAALEAAKKQVQAAEAGWTGASARANSARAARDRAALELSYARILAPCSGVVSRKTAEVGQYVQAGQSLMTVVPLDDVWVVANLKETEIREVTPGDKAEIEVDAYPGRKFTGHVESLSPATGARFSLLPPDNATGNFTKVVQRIPVRIRVDGPFDAAHPLRPGMSVNATVVTK